MLLMHGIMPAPRYRPGRVFSKTFGIPASEDQPDRSLGFGFYLIFARLTGVPTMSVVRLPIAFVAAMVLFFRDPVDGLSSLPVTNE